ncbi:MAG: hypothetical protein LBL82_00175 [Oscillospiraceae bacterium]|jgi:hypothetical protein|nr:hypothetical protein [Oscillospiraceae bacterium]
MANIFSLFGTIFIDNEKANKGIDETTKKGKEAATGVEDLATKGEKTESRLGNAFKKVGSLAVQAGKVIMSGLAIGATAMTGLTIKSLELGGDLEQNMGGSNSVFKNYAKDMQNTAKDAYKNMGLNASEFLTTANKMGALFQGSGFTIKQSADMSSEAMQRAADVASIMGLDTSEAMEAVAGAAKGNFTMMDNLGVSMNDTAIKAYALEKGIKTTGKEMTQQEKIGIAMQMFLDKTAYAAGNYAKENETLAGSLGTAKASLSNFLSGAGDASGVVESFSNVANVVIKNLETLLPRLTNGISEIVEKLIPKIPPIINKVLPPIILGATTIINGLISAIPSLINVLVGALPQLIQGFVSIFALLAQSLPEIIQPIIAALPIILPALITGAIQIVLAIVRAMPQILKLIIDALPSIIISIIDAIMSNLPQIIEGLINLVIGIVQAIPQIISVLIESTPIIIDMVITGILDALPQLIEGLIKLVIGIVKALPHIIDGLVLAMPLVITSIANSLLSYGYKIWDALTGIFSDAWESVKKVFAKVGDFFAGVFSDAVERIKSAFGKISNFFSSIFNSIVSVAKIPLNFIIDGINIFLRALNRIKIPDWVPGVGGKGFNFKTISRLRVGLEYVPYDDFPAILHKGEQVLTAGEARAYKETVEKQAKGDTPAANINIVVEKGAVNIERFHNDTGADADNLIDTLMELIEDKIRRKGAVFA